MPSAAPPLQAPLFWQICVFGWLGGLLTLLYPLPALAGLGILILTDERLSGPAALSDIAEGFPASRAWRLARVLLVLCCFIAGAVIARFALPDAPASPDWLTSAWREDKAVRVTGMVHEVQGLPDARLRILLRDVRSAQGPPLDGLAALTWENPTLRPGIGQTLEAVLRIQSAKGLANPGVSDIGQLWRMRGVFWRASLRAERGDVRLSGSPEASWLLREQLRERLVENLARDHPGPRQQLSQSAGVLPALIFGDRFFLTSTLMQHLSATSLIHSLALSGQHLSVVGLFAVLLVGAAGHAAPRIFLYMPRRKALLLASLPPALLYLWIGAAPPSLLRAAIMLGLFSFWLLRNRVFSLSDALFGAVFCITLISPLTIFDVGLQLSVLSVTAIALCTPLLRRLPLPPAKGFLPAIIRRSAQILCVSFCIQLFLTPALLLFFNNAGPWFFLNLFWLPLMDCFVLPLALVGMLLLAAGAQAAASIVCNLAISPCELLLAVMDIMARHGLLAIPSMLRPHWTALLAFLLLMPALALLPGRHDLPPAGRRLFAVSVLLFLIGPSLRFLDTVDNTLSLRLMDVGQGQAVLLQAPGGARMLIDGGNLFSPRFDIGKDVLAPALSTNHAPRLEWIVNSHPDRDHLYGLFHLLKHFDIGHFAGNGDKKHKLAKKLATFLAEQAYPRYTLTTGDSIQLAKGLRVDVLHPPSGFKGSSNNTSLVLRLLWNDAPLALIPGDAERAAIQHMLDSGLDLRAPVLILPHHGGISSFAPKLYDAVGAQIALVSNGPSPRYPALAVRDALATRGIRLIETSISGQIALRWKSPASPPEIRVMRVCGNKEFSLIDR